MEYFEKMDEKKRRRMLLDAVAFDAVLEGMNESADEFLGRKQSPMKSKTSKR